jgi:hypothetical protein
MVVALAAGQRPTFSLPSKRSIISMDGTQRWAASASEFLNREMSLADVAYWAYQIQDVSATGAVDSLVVSHCDMLVLEPTRTDWSSDDRYFDTKRMIMQSTTPPPSY